jgi:hypothetical protein
MLREQQVAATTKPIISSPSRRTDMAGAAYMSIRVPFIFFVPVVCVRHGEGTRYASIQRFERDMRGNRYGARLDKREVRYECGVGWGGQLLRTGKEQLTPGAHTRRRRQKKMEEERRRQRRQLREKRAGDHVGGGNIQRQASHQAGAEG